MLRKIRRYAINKRGQAMVEFALLLPVLALVLFGIIEFGLIFNASLSASAAAREGARLAAVNDVTAKTKAESIAGAGSTALITYDPAKSIGAMVSVTVTNDVTITMPIISSIVGDTVTVTGTTKMRIERL